MHAGDTILGTRAATYSGHAARDLDLRSACLVSYQIPKELLLETGLAFSLFLVFIFKPFFSCSRNLSPSYFKHFQMDICIENGRGMELWMVQTQHSRKDCIVICYTEYEAQQGATNVMTSMGMDAIGGHPFAMELIMANGSDFFSMG